MSDAERQNLARAHGLSEVEKGALLEITGLERKQGEYGEYGLARYMTTLKNGVRVGGLVRLNANILENAELKAPCVLLYEGLKIGGKLNKPFHDVSVLGSPAIDSDEIKQFADGLRKLPMSSLRNLMQAARLSSLPAGAVVVYSDVQKRKLRKNGEETLTIKYETIVNGEERQGTMIIPIRLEPAMKDKGCGLFVYQGMRKSQLGREYHDVNVLDESVTDCL